MIDRILLLGMVVLLGWLVACTSAPPDGAGVSSGSKDSLVAESPSPDIPAESADHADHEADSEPSASLIEDLKTLLATERGIPSSELFVKQTAAVEWSDSCLGAARADEICAQVITPGYRIVLGTLTEQFEFHTDRAGRNVRQVEAEAQSERQPTASPNQEE